jgi:excisionase family DNA binding protein
MKASATVAELPSSIQEMNSDRLPADAVSAKRRARHKTIEMHVESLRETLRSINKLIEQLVDVNLPEIEKMASNLDTVHDASLSETETAKPFEGTAPLPRLLYTVDEAAAILRIHYNTVYGAIHAGLIPARRKGRRYLIRHEDIERFSRADVPGVATRIEKAAAQRNQRPAKGGDSL